MRMTASSQEQYPLLGSLLEAIDDYVGQNTTLKDAVFRSCGGRDADLTKAFAMDVNPWVTVSDIADGDKRGGFSSERENTIVIGRALADRLVVGGDKVAYRDCATVLLRGLLHWLAQADWTVPESPPGAAFDQLCAQLGPLKEPEEHEKPPSRDPATSARPDPPPPPDGVAHLLGATVLDKAKRHLGQEYRFEPTPDYNDADWKGPFDCAEYVSYCVFRAYEIPYGVVADPAKRFNAYSGYWERDAKRQGTQIPWRDALRIPGAILLRFPPPNGSPPFGHVAISLGNGSDVYSARGRAFGVMKHPAGANWNTGVLIPGVLYDMPDGLGSDNLVFKVLTPPAGYSEIVESIERQLVELGFLERSEVNGIYDVATAKAVRDFQRQKGILEDGEVGMETGTALGLGEIWDKAPVANRPALADNPPVEGSSVDAEILTLARTLYGETRGEPEEGIEAVANVILNRVKSNRYPNSISKVCLQRRQFSCWNPEDPNFGIIRNLVPGANPKFDMILKIASTAVLGGLPSLVGDALFYHAVGIKPSWVINSPGAQLVKQIGHHLFWTGIL